MAGKPQNLPAGQWTVSNKDKKLIREMGRELEKFISQFAKTHDGLETKIVVGAFDYVSQMINLRSKLISDRYMFLRECVSQKGLEKLMEEFEPFQDTPEVPEGSAASVDDMQGHPTESVPPKQEVPPVPQPADDGKQPQPAQPASEENATAGEDQ